MLYAYKLSLKVSSKCIHPNYYFYCFECVHRVCPNLSSAPCISHLLCSPIILLNKYAVNSNVATSPGFNPSILWHSGPDEELLVK